MLTQTPLDNVDSLAKAQKLHHLNLQVFSYLRDTTGQKGERGNCGFSIAEITACEPRFLAGIVLSSEEGRTLPVQDYQTD